MYPKLLFCCREPLKENLMYGNDHASMDDIIKATKIANIHNFINSLPDKYETILTEHGHNLSEGQKQRFSIARALVKDPDILVMDEPTSALDNITEKSIYNSLPASIKNKTTFTIAHRLNTIKDADKVILLTREGYFLGSHSEMIKNCIPYQNFFDKLVK